MNGSAGEATGVGRVLSSALPTAAVLAGSAAANMLAPALQGHLHLFLAGAIIFAFLPPQRGRAYFAAAAIAAASAGLVSASLATGTLLLAEALIVILATRARIDAAITVPVFWMVAIAARQLSASAGIMPAEALAPDRLAALAVGSTLGVLAGGAAQLILGRRRGAASAGALIARGLPPLAALPLAAATIIALHVPLPIAADFVGAGGNAPKFPDARLPLMLLFVGLSGSLIAAHAAAALLGSRLRHAGFAILPNHRQAPAQNIRELVLLERQVRKAVGRQLAIAAQAQGLRLAVERLSAAHPIMIVVLRLTSGGVRLHYASADTQERFGIPQAAFADGELWLDLVHPDDRDTVRSALGHAFDQAAVDVVQRVRTEGGDWRWLLTSFAPHEDDDVRSLVACIADVSEIKSAEARAWQSSKMALLAEMATGIAHELNQPLNVIRLAAENMSAVLAEDGPIQPQLLAPRIERIIKQTVRASELIDRMRVMELQPDAGAGRNGVKDLLQDAIALVAPICREAGLRISLTVEEGLPDLPVDRARMVQALVNLLLNGYEALIAHTPAGRLRLEPDEPAMRVAARRVSEGRIRMEIGDRGCGISDAVQSRMFDPFFTTKEPGLSVGLGLPSTYGIVREHGGSVWAECSAGETLFVIELPLDHTGVPAA